MINIYQPVSGGGGGLTIGTTTITSGTTTRLLFDAAGVVSETNGATWDATNKALTVGGATVTTSNPVLNLSQTWNDGAVTFTGLKLNVTNTASASASLLMDLQVGGASKFNVLKTGAISIPDNNTGYVNVISLGSSGGAAYIKNYNGSDLEFGINGSTAIMSIDSEGPYFAMLGGYPIVFSGGGHSSRDVGLSRSAAGIIRTTNGATGGGSLEFLEQTAPSAGASNTVRLYAQDNGAGKTQLMALFNSGAAQQVAIEP